MSDFDWRGGFSARDTLLQEMRMAFAYAPRRVPRAPALEREAERYVRWAHREWSPWLVWRAMRCAFLAEWCRATGATRLEHDRRQFAVITNLTS